MTRWTRASHEIVADAMRVRRWALATLTARRSDVGSRAPAIASIPPAIWRLVLRTECAALPVLRALPERGAVDPAIRALVTELSIPELQRCMTVRAQLRELDVLCARHGLSPVLLKGAVSIARGRELDLGDVDVYLPPAEARRFAELVDRNGYEPGSDPETARHLARRSAPQRLPLEIHHTLQIFASERDGADVATVPLQGYEALRAFAPAAHAWHVLHECVAKHPHRRGSLRDLLSIGFAIDACSDDDKDALRARAQTDHRSREMFATIDLASAVRDGRLDDVLADDHLDRLCAARYALANPRFERWFRLPVVGTATFIALEPGSRFSDLSSFLWPRAWRWQRAPRGPLARITAFAEKVARLAYRSGALSIGASIAASVSRTVRRSAMELSRSA